MLLSSVARAQVGGAWVNVTRVESRQMKNAVSLTLEADGTLQFDPWFSPDPDLPSLEDQLLERRGTRRVRREVTVLRFRIPNARTQVGSFVDVSKYPIDHVELSIPPQARLGVGLDITIVFHAPVLVGGINVGDDESSWRERGDERRRLLYITMPPDQRSLKLIVTSERLGEDDGDKPATRWTPPRRELRVDYADGRLSVHALHADLRALLNAIADKAGISIRVDDTLERLASLHLPDVAPEDALRAIAVTYGLALRRDAGSFVVSEGIPRRASPYQLAETRLFPLKYIRAVTARDLLPLFLLRYAHVNTEQNALSVAAPAALLDKVASDLAALDTPTPQLVIEAVLVEFFSTKEMEAFLSATFRDRSLAAPTLSPSGYGMNAALGQLFFRRLGVMPSDFGARLRAVVTEDRGRLRAQPKAVVRNGQTARLFVGQTQYIQIQVPARFGPGGVTAEALGVDLGVKFEVTPWTGGQGGIHLQGMIEVSNIVTQDPVTRLPDLATRRAEVNLRLQENETVFIGGLEQSQQARFRQKIPILGDLPLIGNLFRFVRKGKLDTRLGIFLTARMASEKERLSPAELEKLRMQMLNASETQSTQHKATPQSSLEEGDSPARGQQRLVTSDKWLR
ncbi:MAG: type II and III secretion system protein [Abditibacteriales bacterium]|nr:type II and III secretion system protein [Abditibacteriales bacterium]MDW8367437.1 type II and III secretion system protein [Abditibacteriales bacterium]